MSYGNNVPPISFLSFNLACLTGENGNGKSALLDAITWAVWGQARGVDKNGSGMDDLVRLGQDEMEVNLTFELEGDIYRIIRKRDKKRGVSLLEFQIRNVDNYRTISGDKIAETQKKIIQILKMDYDTFINSAFVLQGKADTFTQQKPNDRKRILGEILGLSYYDELEKKAREKFRFFESTANGLEQQINLLKEETKDKEEIGLKLSDVKKNVDYLGEAIKAKDIEHQSLLEAKQDYDEALSQVNQLKQRITLDQYEITKIKEMIDTTLKKVNQGNVLVQQEAIIINGYNKYLAKLKAKVDLQQKQNEFFDLNEIKNQLENKINDSRRTLEINLENLEREINEISNNLSQKGPKETQFKKFHQDLANLPKLKEKQQFLEDNLKGLETQFGITQAKIPELKETLQKLKDNYLTLKKAPKCPYCSTDLQNEDSKIQVLGRLAKEGKEASNNLKLAETRSEELQELIKSTIEELNIAKKFILEKEQLSKQVAVLERELEQFTEHEKKLSAKKDYREKLKQALAPKNFMITEQNELNLVLKKIGDLNYDKETLTKVTAEVETLSGYPEQLSELKVTKDNIKELQTNLNYYRETLSRKEKNIQDDQALCKLLQKRADELQDVTIRIKELLQDLEILKLKLSNFQQEKGALQDRYQRCLGLEKERKVKENEWRAALTEKNYYLELAQAFGKKGIQAIIIENAIPELQNEANRLLNRMTDGRLNVSLLTQKGTKSGTVVETLDIQISDELGTRKYEMYSGGEAFRVNFALRIALSKLLAKRAGARLQTLVIDEGFGTQDGKGKERLIELINAIQDDFSKIIVITHIQELKDAFPVHLEVRKGQEGSTVFLA